MERITYMYLVNFKSIGSISLCLIDWVSVVVGLLPLSSRRINLLSVYLSLFLVPRAKYNLEKNDIS